MPSQPSQHTTPQSLGRKVKSACSKSNAVQLEFFPLWDLANNSMIRLLMSSTAYALSKSNTKPAAATEPAPSQDTIGTGR